MSTFKKNFLLLLFLLLLPLSLFANTVRYELVAEKGSLNLSGKQTVDWALMINGSVPAPTLEFTEGDDAEILVTNKIADEELSLHWHGILLPPLMDGVSYITTPPIHPGQSFLFKFKIRQHGTYWYHSHTSVQEQKGLFGAIVIHPKKEIYKVDQEVVVVVSDWSDEKADHIIKNLRKDGDYYVFKKDTIRSWKGAVEKHSLTSYLKNLWQRMEGMDLSDVGYDAFLINGKRSSFVDTKKGLKIRLRIINASASSYFYISLGGLPMNVISADGIDIQPNKTKEILLAIAETYDVLFEVPDNKSYELRATVQDVTGYTSLWLGQGEKVFAPNKAEPNLYEEMSHSMDHANHSMSHSAPTSHSMDHSSHKMDHSAPTSSHSMDHTNHSIRSTNNSSSVKNEESGLETLTVDDLRAKEMTHFHGNHKTHNVKLELNGDMERYVWHINGKAIYQDHMIEVNEGDIVRFHFDNKTMMHHPMHLHGHFFRVLNKHDHFSPLKHTVDVPPHSQRSIEFLANEPGQWMFHCHNLYHMKSGMSRIVSYKGVSPPQEVQAIQSQSPMFKNHIFFTGMVKAMTNKNALKLKTMRTWDELELQFESSSYDKLEHGEGELWYRYWVGRFFNFIVGGTYFSEFVDDETRGIFGFGYTLPLLVEVALLVDHKGDLRFDIEKKFQWTKYIFSELEVTFREEETDFEASLMYANNWTWAAGLLFSDDKVGAGLEYKF